MSFPGALHINSGFILRARALAVALALALACSGWCFRTGTGNGKGTGKDLCAKPFPGYAYPPLWRGAAVVLSLLSRVFLVVIAWAVAASDEPIPPPALLRALILFAAVPALAVWLINRAFASTMSVANGILTIERSGLRLELDAAVVTSVAPWRLPLPRSGVALLTQSGWCVSYSPDGRISDFLVGLHDHGGCAAAADALDHPAVTYGDTKLAAGHPSPLALIAKFAGFGLAIAAIFFNAHQHITYGGPLGEYHLLGLRSYLQTLAIYWSTMVIYLLLYAAAWRWLVELANLATAYTAPRHAARLRRASELLVRIAYYAGVPVLVALRFLA